ncbi:hypothetical protein [Haloechinothrix alba]|uniref:hypothetical protein n=1 Tax=Haloechinothrix alba TaxID=664784 RepID=UPI0015957538|nr:hypothetical protein [Haloechinothrix alba]
MTPASAAGLHCGCVHTMVGTLRGTEVTPAAAAGLHCGEREIVGDPDLTRRQ